MYVAPPKSVPHRSMACPSTLHQTFKEGLLQLNHCARPWEVKIKIRISSAKPGGGGGSKEETKREPPTAGDSRETSKEGVTKKKDR